jgi:hypothetical protein
VTNVVVNGSVQQVQVGPPTSKDQCKNGGWKSFNNPTFKNQGQCVSYFNHASHEAEKPKKDKH